MDNKPLIISVTLVFTLSILIKLVNILRFPVLPTAFDPWYHMSIVNSIIEHGYVDIAVYRGGILLHLLTAVIHLVTGISVFDIVKYLPLFLGPLTVFCMYHLVRNVTDNPKIVILSVFSLTSLSFSFIFATNQFWPELLTLPLMILSLSFFLKAVFKNSASSAVLSVFLYACIVLTHDFSALMAFIMITSTMIFTLVGTGRVSKYSIIIVASCFSIITVWSLMFTTAAVLASILSKIYFLIPVLGLTLSLIIYIFKRIKVEGDYDSVHFSKLTYPLWGFFTLIGLILTLIVTIVPPFSYLLAPTIEYLVIALPGTVVFLSLISLGALIIFQNFHKQSSIIVGIIAGPVATLLLPYILYLVALPIIETERILEFASIGGALICGLALSVILQGVFNSSSQIKRKIYTGILIPAICIGVFSSIIWAYPTPSGGLKYLNWNTYSELDLALWASHHIQGQTVISDWRIGYILTGFMADPPNYSIIVNALLLYEDNRSVVISIPHKLGLYMVLDDWMILNGPTQPPTYGLTEPLENSKNYYDGSSEYVKIYDNGYEWIYFTE